MSDEYYMQCALDEAMDAFEEDEVPVGAGTYIITASCEMGEWEGKVVKK